MNSPTFSILKAQLQALHDLCIKALEHDACMSFFIKRRNDFNQHLDRARDRAYITWKEGFDLQQAVDGLSSQVEAKQLKQMKELRNEVATESDPISAEASPVASHTSLGHLRLRSVLVKVPATNFSSRKKAQKRLVCRLPLASGGTATKLVCNFG